MKHHIKAYIPNNILKQEFSSFYAVPQLFGDEILKRSHFDS